MEVYKNCSGSWLEDQDFFRFFGIFRSVYLYAKPALHIEDLWLQAGLEPDNTTGTLAPRLRLSAAEGASLEGCSFHCTVAAPGGAVLWDAPMPLRADGSGYVYGLPVRLPGIRKWDHSDPRPLHRHFDSAGRRRRRPGDGALSDRLPPLWACGTA